MALSFTKQPRRKEKRYDYDIYIKRIHLVIPKQVVNVVDLGYLVSIENDFPEQLSSTAIERKENTIVIQQR